MNSTLRYAERLISLQKKLPSHLFIMRVFLEKPRTFMGWKGFLSDPDRDGSQNLEKGLFLARELLYRLAEKNLPVATEFVSPFLAPYLSDLITWGFIGARTSTSQIHREFAASLNFPLGCKNSLDGNMEHAIQSALLAKQKTSTIQVDEEGRICSIYSQGNPHAHVVLRGSNSSPNFDQVDKLYYLLGRYQEKLPFLIDCAHGNSQKTLAGQKEVFEQIFSCEKLYHAMSGCMVESFLKPGKQTENGSFDPELSLTDPCLGIEETEELFLSSPLAMAHS